MPIEIEDARIRLAALDGSDPARLREWIRRLAQPRMSGTAQAHAVAQDLRQAFEELGYEAREMPFSFSAWPGRFGISVAGGALALGGAAATWTLAAGLPGAALVILVLTLGLALAPLLALEWATARMPWGRVESSNHLFQLPRSRPAWIVMAHRDSKSQLAPTLIRSAAIGLGLVSWLTVLALALLAFGGEAFRFTGFTILAGVLLVAAGLVLGFSWASNESPGALDNASGLAALLEVAAGTREQGDVAFLVTDAEELGLVGAHIAAPLLPAVQGVINVDSLDDHGTFFVAEGYGWRRRGSAPQLAAALLTAAVALDLPIRRRRLPLTLPVDHLPIAEAGIPALTLFRGGWHSLLRVHSRSDDSDGLEGTGAAKGATLLRAAMRLLHEDGIAHLAGRRSTSS